jgi:hypothetical protein
VALNNIFKDKGTHFDEHFAIEFIKCIGIYPPGTLVELKGGQVALILATNAKFSRLPKVIIVLGPDKNKCKEKIYDLRLINSGELDDSFLIKRELVDGAFGITIKAYQEKGLIFSR